MLEKAIHRHSISTGQSLLRGRRVLHTSHAHRGPLDMVPTPKRVDSVEVHNTSSAPVKVTVTYDNHKDNTEEHETQEIAPGGVYHFPEKSLDMGSWTAVAPVKSISAGAQNLAPSVSGVVKKLVVHVGEHGALKQQ